MTVKDEPSSASENDVPTPDDAPIGDMKGRPGRPFKLYPTEATIERVHGLGKIQATTRECADYFGVNEVTWIAFKKRCPEIEVAYQQGSGAGRISLRRKQVEEALKGNPTMLVWLGKQMLGQVDKQEISGPNGGAMEMRIESPRDLIAARISALAARSATDIPANEPDK